MKEFQSEYAFERDVDDKTTYLFFFDEKAGDRDVNGFMPRNKQLGYIFTQGFSNEENLAIAVAHELGHGQFLLKHPFDNSYGLSQNAAPDNLMDYSNGAHLSKWQWDMIKSPGVVNRVFEADEDAMKIEIIKKLFSINDFYNFNKHLKQLKEYKIFNYLYEIVDDSPEYVLIYGVKITNKNFKAYRKYMNTNGGFLPDTSQTVIKSKIPEPILTEIIKQYPFAFYILKKVLLEVEGGGSKEEPHEIMLMSPSNERFWHKELEGKFKGDGFEHIATLFEEIFHAAHYLYLKNRGLFDLETFYSQTETEVEIISSFLLYTKLSENKDLAIHMDDYFFATTDGFSIDPKKKIFFDNIIKNKELTDENIEKYKSQIEIMIQNKIEMSGYKIDKNKIDYSFLFLKKIIDNEYKK